MIGLSAAPPLLSAWVLGATASSVQDVIVRALTKVNKMM